jgi:NADH-quinone oxidoreductase subunit A
MRTENHFNQLSTALLFIIGGLLFSLISLTVWKLLRSNKPTEITQVAYESGEEPIGSALGGFNIRFYMVALLFVLFDVELVFLFPWAVVMGNKQFNEMSGGVWGYTTLIEAFVFVLLLGFGLAYAWKQQWLGWAKAAINRPKMKQVNREYELFNEQVNRR